MKEHMTIEDMLQDVLERLSRIEARLGTEETVLTVKDLAQRNKCSASYLRYTAPWMLPNNGKSDFDRILKWTLKTVQDWEQIPIEERKAAYYASLKEEAKRTLAARR